MIRFYWERFLDWLTGRRIADLVVSAVGELTGPVRHVYKMHDYFIVITDRDVYAVYYDYNTARPNVRRVRP
jgi:hypothetical protein